MTIRHTEFELYNEDGDPIRGDVWGGGEARGKAAVVICHGFKGFKNWGFFPYAAQQLVESISLAVGSAPIWRTSPSWTSSRAIRSARNSMS
jgi:hypothetical protein